MRPLLWHQCFGCPETLIRWRSPLLLNIPQRIHMRDSWLKSMQSKRCRVRAPTGAPTAYKLATPLGISPFGEWTNFKKHCNSIIILNEYYVLHVTLRIGSQLKSLVSIRACSMLETILRGDTTNGACGYLITWPWSVPSRPCRVCMCYLIHVHKGYLGSYITHVQW